MDRQAIEHDARPMNPDPDRAGPMSFSVGLRYRFPSIQMDIAFEVPSRAGRIVLSGPSGGKSTVISVAAGLVEVVFSTDVFSGVIPRLYSDALYSCSRADLAQ